MDKEAQLVFIILLSFSVLTVVLYYFHYVSIYSYVLVFLIIIILVLIMLIRIYNGKGFSCIEQRDNKPGKLTDIIYNNLADYLGAPRKQLTLHNKHNYKHDTPTTTAESTS